jgi:hypothetical protein
LRPIVKAATTNGNVPFSRHPFRRHLMEDTFDVGLLRGESRLPFDHGAADSHFGASVFWMRQFAAHGGEQAAVEFRQTKRDGSQRGIVEIIPESP